MSYLYRNIICAYLPNKEFHDDMFKEEVEIIQFPYMSLFGDFRILNGLRIEEVDEYVGKMRQVMVNIANRHKEIERERKLRAEQGKVGVKP